MQEHNIFNIFNRTHKHNPRLLVSTVNRLINPAVSDADCEML